jgi:cystathionine gamma-synthase
VDRVSLRAETLAVHAGRGVDPITGALATPLNLSTTFERDADGDFSRGFAYTREGNPTRAAFERALAVLEGGAACIAFASGMAAISALFQAQGLGARLVVPDDMYFGNRQLLFETPLGKSFEVVVVDMTDLAAVQAACAERPALVWIETPSNPLIRIVDIAGVVSIARTHGARTACDNTWPTPLGQSPLALGCNYAVHSVTKYISGHHDAMSGAIVCASDDEQSAMLRTIQAAQGAVPSPFDLWLALRGLQSLAPRLAAHEAGAAVVARFLTDAPGVSAVYYPGLAAHPGHTIAKRQMRGFGAMLSFEVADAATAFAVAARLKLFTRATSLGGTHSLVEHRASVEGAGSLAPPGLLRLSIGLEHPDDLVADLARALG